MNEYSFCFDLNDNEKFLSSLHKGIYESKPHFLLKHIIEVYPENLSDNNKLINAVNQYINCNDDVKKIIQLSIELNIHKLVQENDLANVLEQDELIEELHLKSFLSHIHIRTMIAIWQNVYNAKKSNKLYDIIWKNGFCGFQNEDGELIAPTKYDDCTNFFGGLAGVKLDGKWGYINESGIEVIPLQFYSISIFKNKIACVSKGGRYGFIDKLGNETIRIEYDFADNDFVDSYARIRMKGKWGYVNENGEISIGIKYEEARPFSENLAAVRISNKWGFINSDGNEAITPLYKDVKDFHEGLAGVMSFENREWGFINRSGYLTIDTKFESISDFTNGAAIVNIDKHHFDWGSIDKAGNIYFFNSYEIGEPVHYFYNDLCCVVKDKKYGFVNQNGKLVIPHIYDYALPFTNNLAAICKGQNWGYIDENGNDVIKPQLQKVDGFFKVKKLRNRDDIISNFDDKYDNKKGVFFEGNFHGKYTFFENEDPWVSISNEGHVIIPTNDVFIRRFQEGVAIVQNGKSKYGVVDINNTIVVDFLYDEILPYSEGLACATLYEKDENDEYRSLKKCGFIDKRGQVIIPFEYPCATPFIEGFSIINDIGAQKYIDRNGISILKERIDKCSPFSGGVALINRDLWFAYINTNGEFITTFKYSKAEDFKEGIAKVQLSTKTYYEIPTKCITYANCGAISPDGVFINVLFDNDTKIGNYDFAMPFSERLAAVCFNGKWGYIDTDGVVKIPLIYYEVESFNNGVARVVDKRGGLLGVIDNSGNLVIPMEYKFILKPNKFEHILCEDEYGYDVFALDGSEIIPAIAGITKIIANINIGIYHVMGSKKWHLYSASGVCLFDNYFSNGYDYMWHFSDGLCMVASNVLIIDYYDSPDEEEYQLKYGFIDCNGTEVIPLIYDEAGSFIEGYAMVMVGDKMTLINKHNNTLTEPKYTFVKNFKNGLSLVNIGASNFHKPQNKNDKHINLHNNKELLNGDKTQWEAKDGLWGVLNQIGNEIIPIEFDCVSIRPNGFIKATKSESNKKANKHFLYDNSGKLLTKEGFTEIGAFNSGRALVSLKGKYGYINESGEISIPLIYSNGTSFKNNYAHVEFNTDNKSVYYEIDVDGKVIYQSVSCPTELKEDDEYYGIDYTQDELDSMYRGAFENDPEAEWNID